jgi:hypothetical protein
LNKTCNVNAIGYARRRKKNLEEQDEGCDQETAASTRRVGSGWLCMTPTTDKTETRALGGYSEWVNKYSGR